MMSNNREGQQGREYDSHSVGSKSSNLNFFSVSKQTRISGIYKKKGLWYNSIIFIPK